MSVLKTTGSFGHNAICDVCGFKFKNYQLKKRWDGYMVCKDDYEMRHPMDFYTTRNDVHQLPWTRPEGKDVFINSAINGNRVTDNGSIRVTSTGDIRGYV